MWQLLDYQSKRLLRIIYELSVNFEYLTVEDIKKINDCSERSVYNDIEEIVSRWNNLLDVSFKNSILFFENRSSGTVSLICRDILNDLISLKVFNLIIREPNQELSYYSYKLSLGESSIMRNISVLNRFLKQYELSIKSKGGLYFLYGEDEIKLRIIITLILLQFEDINNNFSNNYENSVLFESVKLFSEEYNASLNHVLLKLRTGLMMISLLRESTGFSLEKDMYEEIIFIEKMISLKPFNKFNNLEFQSALFTIYKSMGMEHNNEEKSGTVKKLLNQFLIEHNILIGLNSKRAMEKRLSEIIYFYVHYPYSSLLLVNRPKIYGKRFSRRHNKLAKSIIKYLDKFKEITGYNIIHNAYEIIYWISLDFPELNFLESFTVLIDSDKGEYHNEQLEKIFSMYFPRVNFISVNCQNKKNVNSYDLKLTTVGKSQEKNLIIQDYPDSTDFKKIYNALYLKE